METKKFGFFLLFFFPFILFAQKYEVEKREIIEQRTDFLLELNESGEIDFTSLFEQLEVFYEQPLNLNTATKKDLEALMLLNGIQINNILKHIEQNGKLLQFEELQSIAFFNLKTIRLILPFIKVGNELQDTKLTLKNAFKEGSSDFFLRYTRIIEEQKGYSAISGIDALDSPNARYLGSADKIYTRYRFKYANNLSIGFTAEKDAGEEFFKGSQPNGFDFYSAHFFAQGNGPIKQIALGDFQAQFGQGLTFWSGLAFGRSPSIFTLKRNAPKLRPYSSVQEDLFLRGGGLTIEQQNFELTVFYSSKKVDANIISRGTIPNSIVFSSLSEDGFHRTASELEDKNVIKSSNIGGNLSYEKRNLSLGITAVHNQLDGTFKPNDALYSKLRNLSNENTNVGFDFNYLFKNANFFGEISKSINAGYAYTIGALIALDPRLSLGIQQRNFEKDYKPIQSNAIGVSSTNNNEKGTFIGIESKISKTINFSAYADRFVFPWLRFQTDAPSTGSILFAQISYQPSKKLITYFRYRNRLRGENDDTNAEGLDQVVDEKYASYRIHLDYQVNKSIRLRNRVEFLEYQLGNGQKETGILVYQDLSFKKIGSPLSFSLRYALFQTDSYNSRIYAYESDVLFAFSIPSYSGTGTRFYIVTKYKIRKGLDLWLRYAQTYYVDRKIIGSGKDEILGPTKSEVKAQLRLKF